MKNQGVRKNACKICGVVQKVYKPSKIVEVGSEYHLQPLSSLITSSCGPAGAPGGVCCHTLGRYLRHAVI